MKILNLVKMMQYPQILTDSDHFQILIKTLKSNVSINNSWFKFWYHLVQIATILYLTCWMDINIRTVSPVFQKRVDVGFT